MNNMLTLEEVKNYLEIEQKAIEQYIEVHDNVINAVRMNNIDPENKIKYIGLAMCYGCNSGWTDNQIYEWTQFFLNKSNHLFQDIPTEYVSYHYYATIPHWDRNNVSAWKQVFDGLDHFVNNVTVNIIKVVNKHSNPNHKTGIFIDEWGIELNPHNSGEIPLPIYYNLAAVFYLCGLVEFMKVNSKYNGSIIAVHNSAFVGFSNITEEQYPLSPGGFIAHGIDLTMVDWNTGIGNAKYWAHKMFIEHIGLKSALLKTECDNNEVLYAQGFVNNDLNEGNKMILLMNKDMYNISVYLNGDGMNNGGTVYFVDEETGYNPPRKSSYDGNIIKLTGYAIALVYPTD